MRILSSLLILALVGSFLGCGSTPEPFEDSMEVKYKHSFDFMYEEAEKALLKYYEVESKERSQDLETGKPKGVLTSKWNTQLDARSTFGFRDRLIVTVTGDVVDGYKVTVMQEEETNTEQANPLEPDEASWDPSQSDGGKAARFLLTFHHRLNPSQAWRDRAVR